MQQVFTALNAATVPGMGPTLTFDSPRSLFVRLQVNVTGSPTQIDFAVEGSLDGVNFFSAFNDAVINSPGAGILSGGGETGLIVALRFNLRGLTGGSSPTVTALLALQDE